MSAVIYPLRGKRVFVAGERGMVGRAIVRHLAVSECEVLSAPRATLDLESETSVAAWFAANKPQAVFLAAAKVGGISANNSFPVDFLDRNLRIAANVIRSAHDQGVEKLLFLGSSCIYPRDAAQPMTEEALLTGPLEQTNQWYAIAKIAGIKLCEAYRKQFGDDFVSVMPTNLYGPGDNYHPEHSHVPAALIRRFHEAKLANAHEVVVWGTGAPRREFLHVDDMADACVFVMERYSAEDMLNIGTGQDVTIAEFAGVVADVVGYTGVLRFDTARPDGTPRKLLDVSKINALGWRARIALRDGVADAYADFLKGNWREA
ncbi:GDP-L-fucose synthase family protein [Candidatus Viadribacter manganicus]|uniref:GDP-L-fucose synthase n=1 Tax=Candidatus Viadribacter manganicus TaxID=1759059 RepID=A0A1B1AJT8_9PROT|nr:GDP-L-fucose synthase [Candidatus Viadribacter manganicus]ANP46813.1 GDP-fucose synthetase [Candidatus Viadribacter manganicus]